jgi:23S rRNA pseudouridine1911/1915/1917 synthase
VAGTTLLEVQLHTGRTHQIRVHFAALKHPVVGDTLYGAAERLRVGDAVLDPLERNFLHAAKIGFRQPRTEAWVEVHAPLPEKLREFLYTLCDVSRESTAAIDAALAPYL